MNSAAPIVAASGVVGAVAAALGCWGAARFERARRIRTRLALALAPIAGPHRAGRGQEGARALPVTERRIDRRPHRSSAMLRRLRLRAGRNRMTRAAPSVCDLMAVCVEAGLTIDQALATTARALRPVEPLLARELERAAVGLGMAADPAVALRALCADAGVGLLTRLGGLCADTLALGGSLAPVLRRVAREARSDRRLLLELRAGRLPVLLTAPLVFCLMPGVLVIVAGPAALDALDSLAQAWR